MAECSDVHVEGAMNLGSRHMRVNITNYQLILSKVILHMI